LAASSSLSPGGAWSPSPPCGGGSAGALERRGAVGSGLAAAASRHYSVIPNGGCARPTRAGSSSTPARRRPGGSQGSPRGPLHVHRLRLRVISGCPVGEFHCDQWLACRLVVMRHAMQPPSNGVPSGPRPPALSRVTRVPVGRDRWLWLRRCPPRTVPLPFEAQVPHDLTCPSATSEDWMHSLDLPPRLSRARRGQPGARALRGRGLGRAASGIQTARRDGAGRAA